MQKPSARHLLLPFNRPEYFSVPEALVSALAWKAYEPAPDAKFDKPLSRLGFMYKAEPQSPTTFDFRVTWPGGIRAKAFGDILKDTGNFSTEATSALLGDAVAQSVLGIRSEKSGNQPASPMTPGLALMQNSRGVMVKPSPPDYGTIIESMYSVGLTALSHDGTTESATQRWVAAVDQRLEDDKVLYAIDKALMDLVHGGAFVRRSSFPLNEKAADWAGLLNGTPFEWLATSWRRLTSKEWVEALPARVWVDWATTVLRLGVGLGYLWEAAWYERIAEAVLNEERMPVSFAELVRSVPVPLPWKSSQESISVREVGSMMKLRLNRGEQIRKFLDSKLNFPDDGAHSGSRAQNPIDFLSDLSKNSRAELRSALNYSGEPARLTNETVKYGLSIRESTGPFTDYYGLLRSRGRRWVVIDPGTEWITVVASLACEKPEESCNVGKVLDDLAVLGIRPELGDVVQLLEKAGLARGSADADIAVIVESAY